MKFAQEFKARLLQDGFPAEWVNSAISYGQLKKCIKRVQQELTTLGLDAKTLHTLLETVEQGQAVKDESHDSRNTSTASTDTSSPTVQDKPFQYLFNSSDVGGKVGSVRPKLLFVVDAKTGEPLSASLAPETRNYLHQLAVAEKLTAVRITDEDQLPPLSRSSTTTSAEEEVEGEDGEAKERRSSTGRPTKLIMVPLTSDLEFFSVLEKESSGLVALEATQRTTLTKDIVDVGRVLGKSTNPDSSSQRSDLDRWRRIFELYLDSRIFFATTERDHGAHDAAKAEKNWLLFLEQGQKANLFKNFKKRDNTKALKQFLEINQQLLQTLKFQEINSKAMTKILKKFDKRTALNAKVSFPTFLPSTLIASSFSRDLTSEVAKHILAVVPRLDDYLCPICFTIAYRPIRLRCQHIFCIRCLIVMQRAGTKNCALCREETVMEADSSHLDIAMQNFLMRYFKAESKMKQRQNEYDLFRDDFAAPGDEFMQTHGCVVM
ncbi:RING-14 protein [Microthyrium microscopicum]|uniref:RING-14 protein n=1 Tax=Microthyrium microscopicum TaxID=703497 RepID=A0A6A6U1C8_9PEZI|nr:RING-14 protein [Microthyrium microscopicum]